MGRRLGIRIGAWAALLVVALGLRLWGLGEPPAPYWDEQYYVLDANVYLGGGIGQPIEPVPPTRIADEGTWVHPPLGKWLIALLGVGPLGVTPWGWRLPAVVFGVLGVGLTGLLAFRLWGSHPWALFAAGLLALDGLHIVQSRMAMLDVFLSTFVVAATLFVVLDRARPSARDPRRWRRIRTAFGSPYRLGAGAMAGAAVATKWSGVLALPFLVALTLAWSLPAGRRAGRSAAAVVGTVVAAFVAVPAVVYVVVYGEFWAQHGPAVGAFVDLQARMLRYHLGHDRVQPENSAPWTWPLLLEPIRYTVHRSGDAVRAIVAVGNPVLWWGFLLALPVAIVGAVRERTWPYAVALGGYGALFLPWLLVPRSQYLFYLLPAVPFMALTVAAALRSLGRIGEPVATGFLIAAGAAAVVALPLWLGLGVPPSWVDALAWFPGWASV